MATNDIKKKTWGPYDPDAKGAEDVVMPEYLTTLTCWLRGLRFRGQLIKPPITCFNNSVSLRSHCRERSN